MQQVVQVTALLAARLLTRLLTWWWLLACRLQLQLARLADLADATDLADLAVGALVAARVCSEGALKVGQHRVGHKALHRGHSLVRPTNHTASSRR